MRSLISWKELNWITLRRKFHLAGLLREAIRIMSRDIAAIQAISSAFSCVLVRHFERSKGPIGFGLGHMKGNRTWSRGFKAGCCRMSKLKSSSNGRNLMWSFDCFESRSIERRSECRERKKDNCVYQVTQKEMWEVPSNENNRIKLIAAS